MLDALIVGAGVSGLHAAWRLKRAGKQVAVCEARGRVGGRLSSASVAGGAGVVDLGATWVWPGERRVAALLEALGLEVFDHFDAGEGVYDGPQGVQRLPAGAAGGGRSWRVAGGVAAVTDALHDRVGHGVVRLGAAVTGVAEEGDGLKAGLADGTHVWARHVLIALPPALAVSRIAFEPGLPPALRDAAAVTPVWMGGIVKTVAVYDTPFWRGAGLSGSGFSAAGPLQEIHDLSDPGGAFGALFGFTGLTRPGQPAPTRAAVLGQLVRLFGPGAGQPRDLVIRDWSRETHTAPPDAPALRDYGRFGDPLLTRAYLGGRLRFCSCETHPGHGHIEDALAASDRAVDTLLEARG